jgi:hypothetical protein
MLGICHDTPSLCIKTPVTTDNRRLGSCPNQPAVVVSFDGERSDALSSDCRSPSATFDFATFASTPGGFCSASARIFDSKTAVALGFSMELSLPAVLPLPPLPFLKMSFHRLPSSPESRLAPLCSLPVGDNVERFFSGLAALAARFVGALGAL